MFPSPIINKYNNDTNPVYSIQKMATGSSNIGLLYSNGEFYGSGLNSGYQFGLGNNTNMYGSFVLSKTGVDSFYIGNTGTILLLKNGTIMFAGQNVTFYGTNGSTTVWTDVTSYFSAVGLSASNISNIEIGNYGTLVLDSTGNLYCIGANSNGEFGRGNTTAVTALTLITTSVQVISFKYNTAYYIKGNSLYRSGVNSGGEFGDASTTSKTSFSQLTGSSYAGLVQDVKCSTRGCMILCNPSTGLRYYYTGIRNYGSQGNGADNTTAAQSFTNVTSMNNKITALCTGSSGGSPYVYHVYANDGIYGCGYDNVKAVGTGGVNSSSSMVLPWTKIAGAPSTDNSTIKFFSAYDALNATFFVFANKVYGVGASAHTGLSANTNTFMKLTNTPY